MVQKLGTKYLNISMALEKLSQQENKIAHFVANGYIAKEIADKLCISPFTVTTHLRNIRTKIDANNIADVTRKYILSLPKATDVLKTMLFLVIQCSVIYSNTDIDLRLSKKPLNNVTRVVRTKK